MYVPDPFAEMDLTALHDAIERYSFATLISGTGRELIASHLPLLLDRTSGPQGTLLGHMAKANTHWRAAKGQGTLAVFAGPHAYISPRWYAAPQTVPTWNYVAVHAYGCLELIVDETETSAILERTVDYYESSQPLPWKLDEPAEFTTRLAHQVVAFRIPIDRLEGKWKLSQNRPREQQKLVIAALAQQGDEGSRQIAELMRQRAND